MGRILTFSQLSENRLRPVWSSMEQPHDDRLSSILITQLPVFWGRWGGGGGGGGGPFYLSGTFCPDGCCRLVDAPKTCCNRENWGEEMLESEGRQQSWLSTSGGAGGITWNFNCAFTLPLMVYLWPYQLMMWYNVYQFIYVKVEIDTKGFLLFFTDFTPWVPPLHFMEEAAQYYYKRYHGEMHHFVPHNISYFVQPWKTIFYRELAVCHCFQQATRFPATGHWNKWCRWSLSL